MLEAPQAIFGRMETDTLQPRHFFGIKNRRIYYSYGAYGRLRPPDRLQGPRRSPGRDELFFRWYRSFPAPGCLIWSERRCSPTTQSRRSRSGSVTTREIPSASAPLRALWAQMYAKCVHRRGHYSHGALGTRIEIVGEEAQLAPGGSKLAQRSRDLAGDNDARAARNQLSGVTARSRMAVASPSSFSQPRFGCLLNLASISEGKQI